MTSNAEQTAALNQLHRSISEMVAIAADENRVGWPLAEDWLDQLQDAVGDGLDAAFNRVVEDKP